MTKLTPDDSEWFCDATTAQLATELLRRSSTGVIALIPLIDTDPEPDIFITDDVPNALMLSRTTTARLIEVVRVIKE